MSDSGYYYYTASFTEEERESLKDFFGRDLFSDSEPSFILDYMIYELHYSQICRKLDLRYISIAYIHVV